MHFQTVVYVIAQPNIYVYIYELIYRVWKLTISEMIHNRLIIIVAID